MNLADNVDMDGKAKLTGTTLADTLNTLHHVLAQVLERGKTIQTDEVNGYLMDSIFATAVLAGWIEIPTVPLPHDLQYVLKPQFRQSDPPPTVMLGGIRVPEKVHDDFISLFWDNQERDWTAENNERLAGMILAWESDPHPFRLHRSTKDATPSPDDKVGHNPAQILIDAKEKLGLTWPKLALKTTKYLKDLEEQEIKDGLVDARSTGELKVDTIFRLLRGENIRVESAKAIAAAIGANWKDLIWPKVEMQAKFK